MNLTPILARLLGDSPSLEAAFKAGKDVTVSARVWRAKTGRWEDLGVIASSRETWRQWLTAVLRGRASVRVRVDGKDVERSVE